MQHRDGFQALRLFEKMTTHVVFSLTLCNKNRGHERGDISLYIRLNVLVITSFSYTSLHLHKPLGKRQQELNVYSMF